MQPAPPRAIGTAVAASRARGFVLGAVAAAFLARAAFGLGYWVDKPLTHDEREYLELAGNLAAGRGFRYDPADGAVEHFGRAPLYPAFLAAVLRASGEARAPVPAPIGPVNRGRLFVAIKVAQAAFGALGVALIAALAWRAAGSRAGSAAAWVAALYPPLVWMPAYVLSETVFSALALGATLVLSLAIDGEARARPGAAGANTRPERIALGLVAASGCLSGLAVLTRPVMLFFVGLVLAWLLLRRRVLPAAAFLCATTLVVAPWTARNVRETGRFVLVASEGGVTFWTGNHPLSPGDGDMAANPAIKQANADLRARHPGLGPDELEGIYYREALASIAAHPFAWAWLVARKFFFLWIPAGPSYTLHSARYFWTSVLAYGLLAVAALAGLRRLPRGWPRPRALGLLCASAVLAALVFFPQERFRIPVIDPVLVVFAAAWLAGLRGAPGLRGPARGEAGA